MEVLAMDPAMAEDEVIGMEEEPLILELGMLAAVPVIEAAQVAAVGRSCTPWPAQRPSANLIVATIYIRLRTVHEHRMMRWRERDVFEIVSFRIPCWSAASQVLLTQHARLASSDWSLQMHFTSSVLQSPRVVTHE